MRRAAVAAGLVMLINAVLAGATDSYALMLFSIGMAVVAFVAYLLIGDYDLD